MVGGYRDGWETNEPKQMTRQEWQTLKVQDVDRLEVENARLREAFDLVLWMAERYAEGRARGSPEMRDLRRARWLLEAHL